MSGLRLTFSDGKRVARTRNFPVAKAVPSLERNSMEAGPGESFTETGIRPNDLPSGWRKSFTVRLFHFAEAASAGQVRRSVSPRLTECGEIEHCCAFETPDADRTAARQTNAAGRQALKSNLFGIETIFSREKSMRKQIREEKARRPRGCGAVRSDQSPGV